VVLILYDYADMKSRTLQIATGKIVSETEIYK